MKIKRILIILIEVVILLSSVTCVNAADKSIFTTAKEWIALGEQSASESQVGDSTYSVFEDMAGLLWGIGIFIVAAVGMVIGIKYMLAEPEARANLKSTLWPYLVGSIVIIGALGIWQLVTNLLDGFAH